MCVVPIFPRVIYCTTQEQFFSVEQREPTETRVCNVHHKFPIFGSGFKKLHANKTGEFICTLVLCGGAISNFTVQDCGQRDTVVPQPSLFHGFEDKIVRHLLKRARSG